MSVRNASTIRAAASADPVDDFRVLAEADGAVPLVWEANRSLNGAARRMHLSHDLPADSPLRDARQAAPG